MLSQDQLIVFQAWNMKTIKSLFINNINNVFVFKCY